MKLREPTLLEEARMALHLFKLMAPSTPEVKRLEAMISAASRRVAEIGGKDEAAAMLGAIAQDICAARDPRRRPEEQDGVPRRRSRRSF